MTRPSLPAWLRHPLAAALVRFHFLPAQLLHPGRMADRVPRALRALPALQRHQSAVLLRQLGPAAVPDLDDPGLPLALLPDAHLDRLLLLLGAALNAPHIRRTITREDLAVLRERLGDEAVAMARTPTAEALAGLPVAPDWDAGRAGELCRAWGAAVLSQAFDAAAPAVTCRARLRLAPEADALRAPLAAAGLQPERALRIARELLHTLEPQWLSSFPATR